MKKILLILFVPFLFTNICIAGGDDRDQILPLNTIQENSVNEESFLQELTKEKQVQVLDSNAANLEQILEEIELNISNLKDEVENNQQVKNFKENYIDSFSGRFILLGTLALIFILILIYSTFISRK